MEWNRMLSGHGTQLTTKELTGIVAANTQAIAANTEAIAANTKSIAEINTNITKLAGMVMSTQESIKSLETVAEALLESANKHEAVIASLEKQLQAYLTTRQN